VRKLWPDSGVVEGEEEEATKGGFLPLAKGHRSFLKSICDNPNLAFHPTRMEFIIASENSATDSTTGVTVAIRVFQRICFGADLLVDNLVGLWEDVGVY